MTRRAEAVVVDVVARNQLIVTINNKKVNFADSSIIAWMTNLMATKTVVQGVNLPFKVIFDEYKKDITSFITNEDFKHFDFLDDSWVNDFHLYKKRQIMLFAKDVVFSFSDGTTWSIPIEVLLNYFVDIHFPGLNDDKALAKTKEKILESPALLVTWAEESLEWHEIYPHIDAVPSVLIKSIYADEWPSVKKEIKNWSWNND